MYNKSIKVYYKSIKVYYRSIKVHNKSIKVCNRSIKVYYKSIKVYYKSIKVYYKSIQVYYKSIKVYTKILRCITKVLRCITKVLVVHEQGVLDIRMEDWYYNIWKLFTIRRSAIYDWNAISTRKKNTTFIISILFLFLTTLKEKPLQTFLQNN